MVKSMLVEVERVVDDVRGGVDRVVVCTRSGLIEWVWSPVEGDELLVWVENAGVYCEYCS